MTAPPFVFNHKTGELERNGKMIALSPLQSQIFACFASAMVQGTRIGYGAIAKEINVQVYDVEDEMPALRKRLKMVDISIASSQGGGKWLLFDDLQPWKPNIPPPICLEGEGR